MPVMAPLAFLHSARWVSMVDYSWKHSSRILIPILDFKYKSRRSFITVLNDIVIVSRISNGIGIRNQLN